MNWRNTKVRRTAGLAACLLSGGIAQAQYRHISGIVVDSSGAPVVDASIDHTGSRSWSVSKSDAKGRFDTDVYSPAIVIRKPGYQSAFLRFETLGTNLKVTLAKSDKKPPPCGAGSQLLDLRGGFGFPQIPRIEASKPMFDVDYQARSYFVQTDHGPKGIQHGSGPLWSLGLPNDQDVWNSQSYEESAIDTGTLLFIVDARGTFAGGNRWHFLGRIGETASYSDVEPKTAELLDRFLDGVCLYASAIKIGR